MTASLPNSDEYKIVEWNTNGWFSFSNPYNLDYKLSVIKYLCVDILVIPETHCMENQTIKIDNFTVFQQNRTLSNPNLRKGSGGIAIAVNNSIMQYHSVVSIHKNDTDGILGLKLVNNSTQFTLGIMGNYLPPDNYHYGRDPEGYFNNASAIWEDLSDCDLCVGTGDVNARTKELLDYIPDIDGNIPPRSNPDNVRNSHGNSFLTFLKDNRTVILNGRITPEHNNYTFVSARGSSVPDYMFCPVDHISYCTEMRTLLMTEVVNMTGLEPPAKLPDHSILIGTFRTSIFDNFKSVKNDHVRSNPSPEKKRPAKKNLKKIGENFFMSPEIQEQVLLTISKLENNVSNQGEIDILWSEVKSLFLNELSLLPNLPSSTFKKSMNKFEKCKPFWNPDLSKCWEAFCKAEKEYLNLKAKTPNEKLLKKNLHIEFKAAKHTFESKFRFFKRKHKKQQSYDLEQAAKFNPTEMWEKLKKLNNPPSSKVVLEIVRDDESISTDIKEILQRWHKDISGLFSGLRDNPDFAFDDDFYQHIKNKKNEFENICPQDIEPSGQYDSAELNSEILYAEVCKCKITQSISRNTE